MWLIYIPYEDGFTFLSKPMCGNHPQRQDGEVAMIYHPNVEDQTSHPEVTMTNSIAAVNYCCIYFLNSKTT